jgi:hypothetical protein
MPTLNPEQVMLIEVQAAPGLTETTCRGSAK